MTRNIQPATLEPNGRSICSPFLDKRLTPAIINKMAAANAAKKQVNTTGITPWPLASIGDIKVFWSIAPKLSCDHQRSA